MKYCIIFYITFSQLYASNQDLCEFITLRNYLYTHDRVIQHEAPIHIAMMKELPLSNPIDQRHEKILNEQNRFCRVILLRMMQNQRYIELLQNLIGSNQITYEEIFGFIPIEQRRERSYDSDNTPTEIISRNNSEEYVSSSRLLSSSPARSSSSDSINSYDTIPYE